MDSIKTFGVSMFTAVALAWGVGSVHAQDYPTMNLRYAHPFAPTGIQAQIDDWFTKEIEKRSGGKIKIRIFWAEQLGKNMEMLDLVGSGAIDMGSYVPSFFPTRLPLSSVTNALPLSFDNAKQAQIIHAELIDLVPEIQDEFKRNKIWPLFFHGLGNFRILCTKPVAKFEDLKNLKIRSYGEHVPKLWASVGAVGITTLPPEVYDGLNRGKLDCAYFPWDLAYSFKLHEVAKYAITADFGAISTWPIFVNYELWHSKWPPNVKKLFTEVSREAVERGNRLIDASGDTSLQAMTKEGGVKVIKFEDQEKLNRAAPDFIGLWVADMEKKGLGIPAKRIGDHWRKRRAELR